MKQLVKPVRVEEVEAEGLIALLNENVMLFCCNYIYAGKLVGVNDKYVKLENAGIVYETGELCAKAFKDVQKLPSDQYVMTGSIESFCKSGR